MKTLVAIPALDMVKTDFMTCLLAMKGVKSIWVEVGSLVHMARNNLVLKAIDGGYDYICFIDSDMVFGPDLLQRLEADAEKGYDFVTALNFRRALPTSPVIGKKMTWQKNPDGSVTHEVVEYSDYPRDKLFEIEACGMAACIIKVEALERIVNEMKCAPFEPLQQIGEDYSCCWRLRQLGVKLYCDSSIKTGHIGSYTITEQTYLLHRQKEAEVKLP